VIGDNGEKSILVDSGELFPSKKNQEYRDFLTTSEMIQKYPMHLRG
jgi:hypothetical protein